MCAFGFRCTAYAGPETGVRDKASYVLEQGDIRFVVSGALDADSPIAEHVRTPRRRRARPRLAGRRRRRRLRGRVARGARSRSAPRGPRPTTTARWSWPRSATYGETVPHLRRPHPLPRPAARARLRRPTTSRPTPVGPEVGLTADRPRRRQRRAGQARRLGALLRRGPRLRPARPLRRRPDRHRVLGAHVDGRVGRLEDRDADQRAGRRPEEEPDPGVRRAPTTAPACSTSPCAPTTSWPRCRRCATAACGS